MQVPILQTLEYITSRAYCMYINHDAHIQMGIFAYNMEMHLCHFSSLMSSSSILIWMSGFFHGPNSHLVIGFTS